jgi:hypothetical protein
LRNRSRRPRDRPSTAFFRPDHRHRSQLRSRGNGTPSRTRGTFGHEDTVTGKAYDEAFIDAIVTSPRVMRQMPRLLRDAGLELVAAFPYVLAEIGKADFWVSAIESLIRKLVPAAGTMTAAEANAWADTLLKDSAAGVLFGASNYYSYVARRP